MSNKILVADDDLYLLDSLSARLKAEGYQVIAVQDSYQAVDHARTGWPDLLLLDINMPAGDGFTVQDRVGNMTHMRGIPVIYLTGDKSQRVIKLAKAYHAFALLYKPFETSELLSTIADALDSRRTFEVA